MRVAPFCTLAAAACLLVPALLAAQGAAAQTEANRLVAGGGITVSGWTGTTDKASDLLNTAKLAPEGPGMRVTTGPAVTYWNPANKATGDYTVKATFNEPKFMNLNDHPHPYGIMIAGNDMGTRQQSYLYCAAYGNGNFIVRGFGPAPFQMNGRAGGPGASVHKAAGPARRSLRTSPCLSKATKVTCTINGADVPPTTRPSSWRPASSSQPTASTASASRTTPTRS